MSGFYLHLWTETLASVVERYARLISYLFLTESSVIQFKFSYETLTLVGNSSFISKTLTEMKRADIKAL